MPLAVVGLLSVAVLRHDRVTTIVPPLTVSRGGLPLHKAMGEESGSSSRVLLQRRRIISHTPMVDSTIPDNCHLASIA
ncbi:MAG: hypothetical protein AAGF95_33755 [Chloroflexota bacterium]